MTLDSAPHLEHDAFYICNIMTYFAQMCLLLLVALTAEPLLTPHEEGSAAQTLLSLVASELSQGSQSLQTLAATFFGRVRVGRRPELVSCLSAVC